MLDGTPAALVFELESESVAPPVPAAAVSVTVPVADWPLVMELGLTERLLRAPGSGVTVIPNDVLTPE